MSAAKVRNGWFVPNGTSLSAGGWQFGQTGLAANVIQPVVTGTTGTPKPTEDRVAVYGSNNGEDLLGDMIGAPNDIYFFTVAGNPRSELVLRVISEQVTSRQLPVRAVTYETANNIVSANYLVGLFDQGLPRGKHFTLYAPSLLADRCGFDGSSWPRDYTPWPAWVAQMKWAVGIGPSVTAKEAAMMSCACSLLASFSQKGFKQAALAGNGRVARVPWGPYVDTIRLPWNADVHVPIGARGLGGAGMAA